MLQLPREPRPGEKLDGNWGALIVRYLRSITPRSSPNFLVSIGANGTTFGVSGGAIRAVGTPAHPFRVINASDEAGAAVIVEFGQVNGITPTIDDETLNTDPAPVLVITTTGVVYLAVVLDVDGEITAATIENAATLPAPDVTHGYLTLAAVTKTGSAVTAINQAVTHSLAMRRCGVSDIHFWGL